MADLLLRDPVKRIAALLLRLCGVRSLVFRSDKAAPIYLAGLQGTIARDP